MSPRQLSAQTRPRAESTAGAPLTAGASADDEWLSGVDRSWDPEFSEQWYRQWGPGEGPWSLSIAAGWASGSIQQLWRRGPIPTSRSQASEEIYALALLEMPLGGLSGPSGAVRPSSELPSAGEEVVADQASEPAAAPTSPPSAHDVADPTPLGGSSAHEAPTVGGAHGSTDSAESQEERANAQMLMLMRQLREIVRRAPQNQARLLRLSSLQRRARHSGLVPELRLRGVLGFDQTTSLEDAAAIVPGETTTRGARDSLLEARLTFRLDRLVYGTSESTLEHRRSQWLDEVDERAEGAVQALIVWLRATRSLHDPLLLPEERQSARDEQRAALVELHLLSDGWFVGEGTLRQLGLDDLLRDLRGQSERSTSPTSPSQRERSTTPTTPTSPSQREPSTSPTQREPSTSPAQRGT